MKLSIKKLGIVCVACVLSASSPMTVFAGKWKQDNNGTWYQNDDKSYPKNEWMPISSNWYYFNDSGYMVKGWIQIKTDWYYCDDSGAKLSDTFTPDGYLLNINGVCIYQNVTGEDIVNDLKTDKEMKILEYNYFINYVYKDIIGYAEEIAGSDSFTGRGRSPKKNDAFNKLRNFNITQYCKSNNMAVRYIANAAELYRLSIIYYSTKYSKAIYDDNKDNIINEYKHMSECLQAFENEQTYVSAVIMQLK